MATESYPSSLPIPKVRYEYGVVSNKLQTELPGALRTRRLRTTSQVFTIRVEWMFTDAQMKEFRDWYAATIYEGSSIFDISLALGNGYKTNTAKFVEGVFSYSYTGHLTWRVSARLEVWNADVPNSASELQAAGALLGITSGGIPLATATLESPRFKHISSHKLNFQNDATVESQQWAYVDSEAIDLATDAILESGST